MLLLNETIGLNQYLKMDSFTNFLFGNVKLISILICKEHFGMVKIIPARHVQTMCYMKPKTWSQILDPASGSWS